MLVKMVKTPKPAEKAAIRIPEKKESFFPRLQILFAVVVSAIAILNLSSLYTIPSLVVEILLLVAGLWMLEVAIAKGFYRKRHNVIKKYI
jgi:hypothetical protein